MEEWKEYKVAEIVEEISMGPFGSNIKVDNFIDFGVPVLNGSNLQGFKLNENSFNYVSKEKADSLGKANAYRGDVVITHRGTLGQIIYIPSDSKFERYVISQSQFRLRLKQDIVRPDFFVYFFHTKEGQHRILMNASQVGVPALARPTSTFKNVSIYLPKLDVQNSIMDVLLALDNRIEVNKRINDNLQQQAQALYKSWFVDFEPFKDGEFIESELGMIPKGWKVVDAEEIFEINIGKTPPRKEHNWFTTNNKDEVWVSIADMGSCGVFISDSSEYLTAEAIKRFNIQMVEKDSVLLSFKLTVGRVAIASTRLTTNEAIARFILPRVYYREFLYLLLKQYKYENLGSTSSIATAVNSKTIKGMRLLVPSDSIIKSFSNLVKPLFDSIESSSKESRRLAQLRDTLLPRLMSGEININEIRVG